MRDDIHKLNMSPRAKAYARRSGLGSMMRQPKDFQKVNAEISNPGKPDKFVNRDAVGKVAHAMKTESKQNTKRPSIKEAATKLLSMLMNEGAAGVHKTPNWIARVPADQAKMALATARTMGVKYPRAVYRDRSGKKRYYRGTEMVQGGPRSATVSGHSTKRDATHADIYNRGYRTWQTKKERAAVINPFSRELPQARRDQAMRDLEWPDSEERERVTRHFGKKRSGIKAHAWDQPPVKGLEPEPEATY